jgi:hypothetical protein
MSNMKRLLALLLVLVLVAASTAPAFAAGGPNSHSAKTGAGQSNHALEKGNGNGHGNGAGQEGSKPAPKSSATAKGKAAPKSGDPKGPSPMARSAFVLGGTISAVDAISATVTITVSHGNRLGHGYYGEPITLTLSSNTPIRMWTPTGVVTATLADLTSGQNVMVKGRMVDGVWTASWVKVDLGLARMPQVAERRINGQ